ncbi:BZ3500_MvSof-1268-A1-R1_Chr3-1g05860 [Microbotryum saponariae]|uniref:BZ3500_MvSof-1268-A1-R1_Chr3-1g05860 protein n=1 Tax=Microbotryum saponariae TaxID=289078 RepID=A0A2X0KYD2_9BASI|nr:BZ3500_MvSof-1268-A1-R1_Chr3-1g05860 [Microbotryum saponariae]SDA05050.1 BZ3501_MvSof-1269-A2-R1_Chr3-1g05530 [Microbotryum saponariae]
MAGKNIIVLGATGEVGRQALASALAAPTTQSVYSFGRRPPPVPADAPGIDKLKHFGLDFDKLLAGDAAEGRKLSEVRADAVVIALGTTRANAGSAANFIKIDRGYVLAAAQSAKCDDKQQTLVYCSSGGSNSSAPFLYMKSKGLTEESLAALSYADTIIARPGYLEVPGGRGESRWIEGILGKVTFVLSKFSESVAVTTPAVGSALVRAALEGSEALQKASLGHEEQLNGHKAWILPNPAILKADRVSKI